MEILWLMSVSREYYQKLINIVKFWVGYDILIQILPLPLICYFSTLCLIFYLAFKSFKLYILLVQKNIIILSDHLKYIYI